MFNAYISGLLSLRRELEQIIDNEVEETLRGKGDSNRLKESIEYRIEESHVLSGRYKEAETSMK